MRLRQVSMWRVALCKPLPHRLGRLIVEERELGLAGEHRVHRAQEPVEVEVVARPAPALEAALHLAARLGPLGTNLGERQVALAELRAAAVHLIEDVHHDVEGLVGARDLLDVEVDVENAEELRDAAGVAHDPHADLGVLGQSFDERLVPLLPRHHELGDVDPKRVALHLDGLEELEGLVLEVEAQPREGLSVAVEERRRSAAGDAVERGHALLAVQDELHDPSGQRVLAAVLRVPRLGRPDKKTTPQDDACRAT